METSPVFSAVVQAILSAIVYVGIVGAFIGYVKYDNSLWKRTQQIRGSRPRPAAIIGLTLALLSAGGALTLLSIVAKKILGP